MATPGITFVDKGDSFLPGTMYSGRRGEERCLSNRSLLQVIKWRAQNQKGKGTLETLLPGGLVSRPFWTEEVEPECAALQYSKRLMEKAASL